MYSYVIFVPTNAFSFADPSSTVLKPVREDLLVFLVFLSFFTFLLFLSSLNNFDYVRGWFLDECRTKCSLIPFMLMLMMFSSRNKLNRDKTKSHWRTNKSQWVNALLVKGEDQSWKDFLLHPMFLIWINIWKSMREVHSLST